MSDALLPCSIWEASCPWCLPLMTLHCSCHAIRNECAYLAVVVSLNVVQISEQFLVVLCQLFGFRISIKRSWSSSCAALLAQIIPPGVKL